MTAVLSKLVESQFAQWLRQHRNAIASGFYGASFFVAAFWALTGLWAARCMTIAWTLAIGAYQIRDHQGPR